MNAAGCEYARNQGDPNAFDVLDNVQAEISQQGFGRIVPRA